jgi:hypothetical protein
MRNLPFLLVVVLAACGGDSQSFWTVPDSQAPGHEPVIVSLELSLNSALYMEGDGKVAVTAVLEATDPGLDIETMVVQMSNSIELILDVSGLLNDTTGTFSQSFDISTTKVGTLDVAVRLVDATGAASNPRSTRFLVEGDPLDWQERSIGLPNALNAISPEADGTGFVAVGNRGTILTSADGVEWVESVSGTYVDLYDVFCAYSLNGCLAVGDAGTILRSGGSGNGSDWSLLYDGPDDLSLHAIAPGGLTGWLSGGTVKSTGTACILHGDLAGDPWHEIEPTGHSGQHITDVEGLPIDERATYHIVASLDVSFPDQGRVVVSADGRTWVEVFISDGHASTYSLEYYEDRVWAGGSGGNIYATADGVNWTRFETPAVQSKLVAVATASNSTLMAHGFSATVGLGEQVGVATSDGGQTWQTFVIGTAFEPRGLAYNDGRWVSVGQSLEEPGKGAIFTTQ